MGQVFAVKQVCEKFWGIEVCWAFMNLERAYI